MTAYGKPYTVRGWGDEVVTTVLVEDVDDEPQGYLKVVRSVGGPVILVPTAALTPVDTTPAEPEPGPYQLGHLVVVVAKDSTGHFYIDPFEPDLCGWKPWRELVVFAGGPDVPIVRLVPAPTVVLPWRHEDREGYGAWVAESPRHWSAARVSAPNDESGADLTPEAAEAMAAALLTAARAARQQQKPAHVVPDLAGNLKASLTAARAAREATS